MPDTTPPTTPTSVTVTCTYCGQTAERPAYAVTLNIPANTIQVACDHCGTVNTRITTPEITYLVLQVGVSFVPQGAHAGVQALEFRHHLWGDDPDRPCPVWPGDDQ